MAKLIDDFTRAVTGMAKDFAVGVVSELTEPVFSMFMHRHLRKLPGGEQLLNEARQAGVSIKTSGSMHMDSNALATYSGVFGDNAQAKIEVKNIFKPRHMASSLYHELQHARQDNESGLYFFKVLPFAHARDALFSILMFEADAHTKQIMAAVTAKTVFGNTLPLQDIISSNGFSADVKKFLESYDMDRFFDHKELARQTFARHMTSLTYYKAGFLCQAVAWIDMHAPTRQDFIDGQKQDLPPPKIQPAKSLSDDYGADYADHLNMRALRAQFLRGLSMPERKMLRMIENLGRHAETMTDQQYADTRKSILDNMKNTLDHLDVIASSDPHFARVQAHKAEFIHAAGLRQPPHSMRLAQQAAVPAAQIKAALAPQPRGSK